MKVLEKAKEACENSNINVEDHFRDITKMIELAKGAKREIEDTELSRYACYLIVQNADPEIELHEKQLEELKKQKKALMQLLLPGIVRVNAQEVF